MLGIADFFIVIIYFSIGSYLLVIVSFECFIEQLVMHFLDVLIAVTYIKMSSAWIYIFRFEFTAVVINRALSYTFNLVKILLSRFCYSYQE